MSQPSSFVPKAYIERGYDKALVSFPEQAFEEITQISGLTEDVQVDEVKDQADGYQEIGSPNNGKAYSQLYKLERDLRGMIDHLMKQEFGESWPNRQLPNGLYESWQQKKEKYEKEGGKDCSLICFADFTDYERVICKTDNWKRVFQPYFVKKESVRESLNRLYPARLDTMHSRPISRVNLLLLEAEIIRLTLAIERVD